MGGGTELSPLVLPMGEDYTIKNQLGQTGQSLLDNLLARQNQGLPEDLKNLLRTQAESAINASLISAKRQAKENMAGRQLPTGSLVRAMGDLYTKGADQLLGVNKDIALGDYGEKVSNRDKALAGFLGLQGLASNMAGSKNQFNLQRAGVENSYNMNKYKIDKDNEFNWGKALGSLFSVGGDVGGAMLGKKPSGLLGGDIGNGKVVNNNYENLG